MQLRLDGNTKLDNSIDILREYEPPEGYYLAFSGGRDSVVLKAVADLAGVKYDAHYNMTTIDPPEVTRFIKKYHPDVGWNVPEKPFWKMVETKGLPTRTVRWCCQVFKEIGGQDRVVLTGIRGEESWQRRKRGTFQVCNTERRWFVNPLMAWLESDVWDFIRKNDLPYCSLYDEGWDRIGCVLCPYQSNTQESMERWPVFWRLTRQALEVYFAGSKACKSRWANADEMWDWWIHPTQPYPKKFEDRPPSLSFEGEVEED